MIFSMTRAIHPDEQVTEQEVSPITQLIQEVRAQQLKISELGNLIQNQLLSPLTNRSQVPAPKSPSHVETIGTDLWELAEMEEEARSLGAFQGGAMSQAASLFTSPPMASANTMNNPVGRVSKTSGYKVAGIPLPSSHQQPVAGASGQGSNDNHQLALTQSALEQWGRKSITWGKKHPGKSFQEVFDTDPGYTRWVQARSGNLHEDVGDYLNYANTRQRLQTMAQQNVNA
jgi:hypothetical protein